MCLGIVSWAHASVANVRHVCEVGRQRIYRVALVSADSSTPGSVFGAAHAKSGAQTYDTKMSGTLTVTDASCEPTGTLQLWNVVQPNLTLNATENGPLFAAILDHDLARPYAVRFDASGRTVSVAHDPAAGEFGIAFVRRLVSAMEVVVPPNASLVTTSWHIDEPDVAGERTSSYEIHPWIEDRLGAATIALHRSTGVEILPQDEGRFVRHSQTNGVGDDDIAWRADGELQSLTHSYAETTRVSARVVSRVQEVLQVDRMLAPRIDSGLDASVNAYARTLLGSSNAAPLHVADTERAVDLRGFSNTLGKETAATLAQALDRAPKRTTTREQTALSNKLAALFYVRPESIDTFLALASRSGSEDTAFLAIFQALGHVGTPRAQLATLALLNARVDDESIAPSIVVSLGLEESPIPQIDPVLERLSERTSLTGRAAELAVGTIAHSVARSDPKREQRLIARIEGRLRSARLANRRRLELLALGNASDPSSYDAIVACVRDPDLTVRAGAAIALRHQRSSAADDTLRAMLSDERSTVRIAAASAFSERIPGDESYSRLQSIARTDPNGSVRTAATDAVWKARAMHSDARAFVAQVESTDRDASVRKSAQAELTSDESQDDDTDLRAPMDAVLAASQ